MERHLSPAALVRLFCGQMAGDEAENADVHVAQCRPCRDLAAAVVPETRKAGGPVQRSEGPEGHGATLRLLEAEQRTALRRLLAHGGWAELKKLPADEQSERLAREPGLQTLEMFHTVLADAAAGAQDDPFLGEERALVAHALAGMLTTDRCSAAWAADLQGEALLAVADCRLLAGAWRLAPAALKAAQGHFEQGTGDPVWEARFLAVQAALARATGHLERAEAFLARAAAILLTARDPAAVAAVKIQETDVLLAFGRAGEAAERAEGALGWVAPGEGRLEGLARSLVAESLASLGQPVEALRSFLAAPPLAGQLGGRREELRSGRLTALLLDGLNHAWEAEKAYRASAAGFVEAALYQGAFLTQLALLGSLVRREAWDKAAGVCEEALGVGAQAGSACQAQAIDRWRDLLALARARRLTAEDLGAARQLFVRHWHASAPRALPPQPTAGSTALRRSRPAVGKTAPWPAPEPPPELDGPRVLRGFDAAMEHVDRQLIAMALALCGGCILETCRYLPMARNTLRDKIKLYGLESLVRRPTGAAAGHLDLSEDERRAVDRLCAQSCWAELRKLPAMHQIERIQEVQSFWTREMFDTVVAAASAAALEDPGRGEETALVARALAGLLPRSWCSEMARHDLFAETLRVIGNCRRLSGDWLASAAAFGEARDHLDQGTGDPRCEARLLSLEASLASDTRDLERALALLDRAAAIYRRVQDTAAAAAIRLQEANALLAGGLHEEALNRAEETLRGLSPKETRLELLARSIVTECLAILERPGEALRSLAAAWPLYERLRGRRTEPQLHRLEALVLDVLGYLPEAEAAYWNSIAGYLEADLYKDAFLILMTRLESLLRRGAWDRAARACEEALALEAQLGAAGHEPMIQLWSDLRALILGQRLTEQRVLEARHAVIRHWSDPAPGARPAGPGTAALRWDGNGTAAPVATRVAKAARNEAEHDLLAFEAPIPPEKLAEGEYKDVIASYDRQLVEAGLSRCGGKVKTTARRLGISRNTLQVRIEKYRLSGAA